MGEGLRKGKEGSRAAAGERALEEEVEDEGPGCLHAILYHHHPRRRSHGLAQEVSPSVLLHGPLSKNLSLEKQRLLWHPLWTRPGAGAAAPGGGYQGPAPKS
jgi:hypothetical protein